MKLLPQLTLGKKILLYIVLFTFVVCGPFWAYYDWPIQETKYVKILGTRDKKIDGGDQRRVQTYIINSDCTIDQSEDPYVFANDDNWWWLKKNSENLQGRAKAWAIETVGLDNAPYVKAGHDGWRITWFSMFPNLISATMLDGCPYADDDS